MSLGIDPWSPALSTIRERLLAAYEPMENNCQVHIGRVKQGASVPYQSLRAGGGVMPGSRSLAGPCGARQTRVQVTTVGATVGQALWWRDAALSVLTDDLGPVTLPHDGGHLVVEFFSAEEPYVDRDVTIPTTNTEYEIAVLLLDVHLQPLPTLTP